MQKKSRINLAIPLLIFLAFAFSLSFDISIVSSINSLRNYFMDYLFSWATYISSSVIILFVLTSLFLWEEHRRRWVFPLWLSLLSSLFLTFIIKSLYFRARPFLFGLDTIDSIAIALINTSSFPSAHAAVAFSALPLLNKKFPRMKLLWIIFAVFAGLSRVYFGFHYLSDVIAGALIGYFMGLFFVKLEEKNKYGTKLFDLSFR